MLQDGDYFKWDELKSELKKSGLLSVYYEYEKKINPEFFMNPFGIHGPGHTKRVLLLNLILAYFHDLPSEDVKVLATAAVYHDIGRTHDGVCRAHGANSIDKLKELRIDPGLNKSELKVVEFIIINHCRSDEQAFSGLKKNDFIIRKGLNCYSRYLRIVTVWTGFVWGILMLIICGALSPVDWRKWPGVFLNMGRAPSEEEMFSKQAEEEVIISYRNLENI